MKLKILCMSAAVLFAPLLQAASPLSNQYNELLKNSDFEKTSDKYEQCVFRKGRQLIQIADFETTMKYAPKACTREFLQIKQLLLSIPVDVNIAEILLPSIAESVEIDLVNLLLDLKVPKTEPQATGTPATGQ